MKIKERIEWLLKSFENSDEGASSRKLSVFVIIACVVFLHIKFVDVANAIWFLITDLVFVLMIYNIIHETTLIHVFGKRNGQETINQKQEVVNKQQEVVDEAQTVVDKSQTLVNKEQTALDNKG